MSNPSRFDLNTGKLLSANGGLFFNNECLQPETNKMQCDVRTADCREELLPGTTCVLLLGETAAQQWLNLPDGILGQIRGAPYVINGIPHIASFFPQDAVDRGNWEDKFHNGDTEDENEYTDDKSHHGKTSRKNYRFWLLRDTKRAIDISRKGLPERANAKYIIAPKQEEIIQFFRDTKNTDLYFDIETDTDLHITCFAVSTVDSPVFTVPLLDWNYKFYYSKTPQILAALSRAINANTLVAHNGAAFDFIVLPLRYGIPLGESLYDTMIAHHRFYPLVEKSLGHCVSLWTYEPFHKDESDFSYNSPESCHRLWSYCGKDVHTMRLVKQAITAAATKIPGMAESINQAMLSIRPYILMSLMGMHYKQDKLQSIMRENDRLMNHYIKWSEMLVGKEAMKYVKGSGKSSMLGSSAQAARYFHELCEYPIIARSQKTGIS